MKYIKTKEWIHKLAEEQNSKENYIIVVPKRLEYLGSGSVSFIPKKYVIKQADTIEELCDEFVVEYENDSMGIFPSYNDLMEYYNSYPQTFHCIKRSLGAIWTDIGLIYVAKFNEEGELELL